MKIVLSNVETNNKGAELMLYAILQEIERKWPNAEVYIPYAHVLQGLEYVKTSIKFRYIPFNKLSYKTHISGILRRMRIPREIIWKFDIVKDADWFIDGSGFLFSDYWNLTDEYINHWRYLLDYYHNSGTKIVFLPQAFGPIELPNTKKILSLISENATLIMPRERVSYNYLEQSGLVDMKKVHKYPDFTSLVDGLFPSKYEKLRNGICIIPNVRMIDMGTTNYSDYVKLLQTFVVEGEKCGRPVYLLNHEGLKDEQLAYRCKDSMNSNIEVVTGLNALEVKGLIASAYLVVTSRFHGLASALNNCVPTLATSWSHKYEELFREYGMQDCVLPLNDIKKATERYMSFIDIRNNRDIRKQLSAKVPYIKNLNREMWNLIWN